MALDASSPPNATEISHAANIPCARPTNEEIEYGSETENLVGTESDGDVDAVPGSSAHDQSAAGCEVAGRFSPHEPWTHTRSAVDAARVEAMPGIQGATHRQSSAIAVVVKRKV